MNYEASNEGSQKWNQLGSAAKDSFGNLSSPSHQFLDKGYPSLKKSEVTLKIKQRYNPLTVNELSSKVYKTPLGREITKNIDFGNPKKALFQSNRVFQEDIQSPTSELNNDQPSSMPSVYNINKTPSKTSSLHGSQSDFSQYYSNSANDYQSIKFPQTSIGNANEHIQELGTRLSQLELTIGVPGAGGVQGDTSIASDFVSLETRRVDGNESSMTSTRYFQIPGKHQHSSSNLSNDYQRKPFSIYNINTSSKNFRDSNVALNDGSHKESTEFLQKNEILKSKREETQNKLKEYNLFQGVNKNIGILFSFLAKINLQLESRAIIFPDTQKTTFLQIIDFEYHIYRVFDELQREAEQIQYKIVESIKEIDSSRERCAILQEENQKLIKEIGQYSQGYGAKAIELRETYKLKDQQESQLNLENSQLSIELDSVSQKLTWLEKQTADKSLEENYKKLQREFENYKENVLLKEQDFIAQISSLDKHYRVSQQQNQKLELQSTLAECTEALKNYQEMFEKTDKLMVKFRQHQNMITEQLLIQEEQIADEKNNIRQLNIKMQQMQQKLDKSSAQRALAAEVPENNEFENQQRFFKMVKTNFNGNAMFNKAIKSEYMGIIEENITKGPVREKIIKIERDEEKKTENNQISLFTPNFFAFIEPQFNILIKTNPDILHQPKKVTFQFLGTVRAILDSQYNEFMLFDDYRQYTQFGDFVFGWVSSFTVDLKTRRVISITDPANGQNSAPDFQSQLDIRTGFYMQVHNPALDQIWEIITFREFLNEERSPDQLFFYLHCRNLLFRGPELESLEATFQTFHYVKFADAAKICNLIMSQFDPSNRQFVISTLKQRIIKKLKNQYVDAHLALRVLLEFYNAERMQRFKSIRDLFYSQNGKEVNGQFSVSLEGFFRICQLNFPDLTEEQKGRLYRQTFIVGRGAVCTEAFFALCSDTCFFTKYLKLRNFNQPPFFNDISQQFEGKGCTQDLLKSFIDSTVNEESKASKSLKRLVKMSEEFGVEAISKISSQNLNFVRKGFKMISGDLQGQSYSMMLKSIMNNWLGIVYLKFFNLQDQWEEKYEAELIAKQMPFLEFIFNFASDSLELRQRAMQFEITRKLKKFQIWIQKKLGEWYNVLSVVLNSKDKKFKSSSNHQQK